MTDTNKNTLGDNDHAKLWWGILGCGCAATWSAIAPHEISAASRHTLGEVAAEIVEWVLTDTPPPTIGHHHPIIGNDTGVDYLDRSPEACTNYRPLEPGADYDLDRQPFQTLRTTGVLWAINRYLFHPRGYALAVHFPDPATQIELTKIKQGLVAPTGWSVLGDGTEPYAFTEADDDEQFAIFEKFLEQLGRGS